MGSVLCDPYSDLSVQVVDAEEAGVWGHLQLCELDLKTKSLQAG